MTEEIKFPYRGWVVKVTPETRGWVAHLRHPDTTPQPLNPRCSADGFCALDSGPFNSALEAVQVAMRWADMKSIGSSMHKALKELVEKDCLLNQELARLTASIRDELIKEIPYPENEA